MGDELSAVREGGAELEAGRELDALIAERVMGRWMPSVAECAAEAERVWETQPGCVSFVKGFDAWRRADGGVEVNRRVPAYSTDIAAAWKVVEKMRADGIALHIVADAADDEGAHFEVLIWRGNGTSIDVFDRARWDFEDARTKADTAPHAICKAALKAVAAPLTPRAEVEPRGTP